jgi:ATP-dependent DNA helicase RecG
MYMSGANAPREANPTPETAKSVGGTARPFELNTPLQFVPGVGPQRLPCYQRLGILRPMDLLFFFPRSYQDIAPYQGILELTPGIRATVVGQVVDIDQKYRFDGRGAVGVLLAIEGGGYVRCVWFNQIYRKNQFQRGMRLVATGIPKSTGVTFEMRHPDVIALPDDQPLPSPKTLAVYPLSDGLQQKHIHQAIHAVLENLLPTVEEALPETLRRRAIELLSPEQTQGSTALLGIHQALRQIHQPETLQQAADARKRFIFQELLVYQLAIASRHYRIRHEHPSPRVVTNGQIHARILNRFPFALTSDQLRVIEEVRADMAQEIPMNRLLQGDVGSGKTVIAQYAMLSAVANKYQAAFMAPTDLLARQHFDTLRSQLRGSQVMIELLTGSISQREQNELHQRIAIGTVDIVVGTQALLSEHVRFHALGLVVIDEQHKFGVEQRAALRDSRIAPHYLVLSATPIPRSIAMTQFGDLDLSILRDKPAGRASVHTYIGESQQEESWWSFVRNQLDQGRQAYVVVPRVDTDEDKDARGVEQVFLELGSSQFRGFRADILHGRMDGEMKQQKLEQFQRGETQVLFATTVVEVGIDVPNATVMTILDANRLGLAQLHQLRGRVARGSFPGYVCVFPAAGIDPKESTRLQTLVSTNDGFELAEKDLQLRGTGDLLGTKQVGAPEFKIAELSRDMDLLLAARRIAQKIIDVDPSLESPEWTRLRKQVLNKHGAFASLSDVG